MLANPSSTYFEREKMDVMAPRPPWDANYRYFQPATPWKSKRHARRFERGLEHSNPYFDGERDRLVSLAARYSVQTVYQWRELATIGGLMGYGTSILDAYHQACRASGLMDRRSSRLQANVNDLVDTRITAMRVADFRTLICFRKSWRRVLVETYSGYPASCDRNAARL